MARSDRTQKVLNLSGKLAAVAALGAVGWIGTSQSESPVAAADVTAARTTAPTVDFVKDIQPIFQDSCLKCHQLHPTNGSRRPSSGFRLDDKAAAMKGGRHGKDIVPGDSSTSTLYHVLLGRYNDVDPMPAAPRGQQFVPLAADKIALIKAWIDSGADWPAPPATEPTTAPAPN